MAESVETVPATTASPGLRVTGRDSPVIMDSSRSAVPATISPSAGTRPPGRTTTTSPALSSAGDTFTVASPSTRSASSGSSAASESSADDDWASERISSQWPSSMMMISSASSHQKSREWSSRPSWAPHDATNATVIARATRSIIPGARLLTSVHRSGEERAAADDVHDRAEHGGDPADQGQVRQRVAEDVGEHAAEEHHRDAESEHPEEQSPVLGDVVRVAATSVTGMPPAGMPSVTGMRRGPCRVLGVVVSGVRPVIMLRLRAHLDGRLSIAHAPQHTPLGYLGNPIQSGAVGRAYCRADSSRMTLSTYRLSRGRWAQSSPVSSWQIARYSSEIRCRSATNPGSVPISEIS